MFSSYDKFLLAILLFILSAATARAADLTGTPDKIYDGDTFAVCDQEKCTKIRVCGIDAPESHEAEGLASRIALEGLLKGKTVRCVPVGDGTVCDGRSRKTSRDRIVAQCFVDGKDIAQIMVGNGHACDWTKFSGGAYSKGKDVCRK